LTGDPFALIDTRAGSGKGAGAVGHAIRAGALACALLLLWVLPRPAFAFDTWWHADATRRAMAGNGFSGDARLVAQFTNYLTDFYSIIGGFEALYDRLPGGRPRNAPSTRLAAAEMERLHFDSLFSTREIESQWATLEANTKASLRKYTTDPAVQPGFRPIVLLSIIGASLHVVQDFYAHSNWVEWHVKENPAGTVPVWHDVPAAARAAMALYTGAYPDGCCPGQKDHDEVTKDSSQRRLHAKAVDAANRASIAWVRLLMEDATIPWDSLKSYKVDVPVGRRFLYDLDATFLTSTSIIAGHFDGARPAKTIFHSDPAREKRMALQAAILVVGGYSTNLTVIDNPYKLPSPYWAGFLVYHIERDLAKGLLYRGQRR